MNTKELLNELLEQQRRALVHAVEAASTSHPLTLRTATQTMFCLAELCGFAATTIALLSILCERVARVERGMVGGAEVGGSKVEPR